jgi:hypothetical protein
MVMKEKRIIFYGDDKPKNVEVKAGKVAKLGADSQNKN